MSAAAGPQEIEVGPKVVADEPAKVGREQVEPQVDINEERLLFVTASGRRFNFPVEELLATQDPAVVLGYAQLVALNQLYAVQAHNAQALNTMAEAIRGLVAAQAAHTSGADPSDVMEGAMQQVLAFLEKNGVVPPRTDEG